MGTHLTHLRYHFDDAALIRTYGPPIPPQSHNVYMGDFMGMCAHDVPCPVCWNKPAIHVMDCTPANSAGRQFQPCHDCQDEGWEINKPRWKRLTWLVRFLTSNLPFGRFDR